MKSDEFYVTSEKVHSTKTLLVFAHKFNAAYCCENLRNSTLKFSALRNLE